MYPPVYIDTIPLAYNDALSYYENLLVVISKYNDLKNELQEFENSITNIVDSEIQKELTSVINQINEIQKDLEDDINKLKTDTENQINELTEDTEREISQLKKDVTEDIENLTASVNSQINNLSQELINVYKIIKNFENSIDQELKAEFEKLEKQIENMISNISGWYLLVLNPVTGKNSNLNTALKDMKESYSVDQGLTALEYRHLQLTALEYRKLQLTAFQYRYMAKRIFFKELYLQPVYDEIERFEKQVENELDQIEKLINDNVIIYDPWTGEKNSIRNILYKLVSFHKSAPTAQEYDNKHYTAEQYDALKLTAFTYDWTGVPDS